MRWKEGVFIPGRNQKCYLIFVTRYFTLDRFKFRDSTVTHDVLYLHANNRFISCGVIFLSNPGYPKFGRELLIYSQIKQLELASQLTAGQHSTTAVNQGDLFLARSPQELQEEI